MGDIAARHRATGRVADYPGGLGRSPTWNMTPTVASIGTSHSGHHGFNRGDLGRWRTAAEPHRVTVGDAGFDVKGSG